MTIEPSYKMTYNIQCESVEIKNRLRFLAKLESAKRDKHVAISLIEALEELTELKKEY